jgi:tRNA A37 threonylcarbamoyladenosine synthetase subunit TsaC/SUA5/YrdC
MLDALGEPIMSSTLLLPGADFPLNDPNEIDEKIGDFIEMIVDAGPAGIEATSVIDLSAGAVKILREGRGDLSTLR